MIVSIHAPTRGATFYLYPRVDFVYELPGVNCATVVVVLDTLDLLKYVQLKFQDVVQIASFTRIVYIDVELKRLVDIQVPQFAGLPYETLLVFLQRLGLP